MIHYEDLAIGESARLGPITVEREAVIDFARRYDPQPFHLSDEGAADTYFGRLAASGWHTASLTMRLLMTGWDRPLASLGSPGMDDLRWLFPVYPGDALTAHVQIEDKRISRSRPEMGLVHFAVETRNQDDRAVMQVKSVSMLSRRESGDDR